MVDFCVIAACKGVRFLSVLNLKFHETRDINYWNRYF